jgi:hypothetical protein
MENAMSRLLSFLMTSYVIGIIVQLAPTAHAGWDTAPASKLFASLMDQLPHAAAWPAPAVETMRGQA